MSMSESSSMWDFLCEIEVEPNKTSSIRPEINIGASAAVVSVSNQTNIYNI